MQRYAVLFVLLAVTLLAAAQHGSGDTSLLTLVNKNETGDVHVQLYGINDGNYYYLTEPAFEHPEESVFEIHKDEYMLAVYACGMKRTGMLNLMKNVRLVFPQCTVNNAYRRAPNAGEPGFEKVDLLKTEPQDGAVDERAILRLELVGRRRAVLEDGLRDPDLLRALYPPYSAQIHWRLDWYNWATNLLDAKEFLHDAEAIR